MWVMVVMVVVIGCECANGGGGCRCVWRDIKDARRGGRGKVCFLPS